VRSPHPPNPLHYNGKDVDVNTNMSSEAVTDKELQDLLRPCHCCEQPDRSTPALWVYWVSYTFAGPGWGGAEIRRDQAVTGGLQILDIERDIAAASGVDSVVVVSLIPLRIEDASGSVIG
jgi:hypothetical protein